MPFPTTNLPICGISQRSASPLLFWEALNGRSQAEKGPFCQVEKGTFLSFRVKECSHGCPLLNQEVLGNWSGRWKVVGYFTFHFWKSNRAQFCLFSLAMSLLDSAVFITIANRSFVSHFQAGYRNPPKFQGDFDHHVGFFPSTVFGDAFGMGYELIYSKVQNFW